MRSVRQTGRPTGGSKAWIHQDKREESRRIHSTTYDRVHSTTSICPDHIDQIIIKTVFVLSVTAIVLPHQRIPPPNLSLISLSTIYLSPSSLLLPLLLLLLPPLSPPLHLPPSHFFFQHLHQLFPPPLSSYPPLLVFNRLPRLLWSSSHHPFFVFSFFLLFFLRPSTINYPEGGKSGHKKIEGKKKKNFNIAPLPPTLSSSSDSISLSCQSFVSIRPVTKPISVRSLVHRHNLPLPHTVRRISVIPYLHSNSPPDYPISDLLVVLPSASPLAH